MLVAFVGEPTMLETLADLDRVFIDVANVVFAVSGRLARSVR